MRRPGAADDGDRPHRRQRVQGVGPRQGALQPRAVRGPDDRRSRYLLGQLTAGQDIKIIKDLGLAAMSLFGLFIAVFIGIGLVSKEVERRSIYALLAKPIRRSQFVLGKYVGLVLTLAVNCRRHGGRALRGARSTWLDVPRLPRRWDAPALDPALLKAIGLIFARADAGDGDGAVLLDVLEPDAVGARSRSASTSSGTSTPTCALRAASSTPGRCLAWRWPSTTCCRTWRRSTSRRRSCTASRRRGRYVGLHPRCTRRSIWRALLAAVTASSRGGTSSRGRRCDRSRFRDGRARLYSPRNRAAAGRTSVGVQVCARSRLPARRRRPDGPSTAASGMAKPALSFDAVLADVYWMRAVSTTAAPAQRRTRARRNITACSIRCARPGDDARSALQRRVPVRRDLSRRAVARRPGPSRSGDRSC